MKSLFLLILKSPPNQPIAVSFPKRSFGRVAVVAIIEMGLLNSLFASVSTPGGSVIKIANQHFVGGLITPGNPFRWIWVIEVFI